MNRIKFVRFACVWCLSLAALFPCQAQADPKQDYQAAKAAETEGDYRTAISIYEGLVAQFPQDPRLRASLARARLAAREGAVKVTLESKLKSVVIPQVEFKDADLDSVFLFLIQKTEELSQGKVKPNFIYNGSAEQGNRAQITLRLTNVPVTEVIRYVGQLTSTSFVYEAHAVVGTPLQGATAQPFGATPR